MIVIKRFLNIFQGLVIVLFIFTCTTVNIPHSETKTTNHNLNKTLDLHAMAVKYEEIKRNDLYTPLDVYNGDLTGYAANCPLCNGHLGCTGQNVLDGTDTYEDKDYGTVRIVASSKNLPCGSILQFDGNVIKEEGTITAIVLDRGVLGTDLDLLVESEEFASNHIGRHLISYNVLRYGYKR